MRIVRTAALTAALTGVVLATGAVTAQAGTTSTLAITLTPNHGRPTDSITVTGDTNPDCASVAYTVTLTYTNVEGNPTPAPAVNGTTDASGNFSQAVTIPEGAVAGEPATIAASVSCPGGAANDTENLTVDAWEGTLTLDKTSGKAGDTVHVSGTLCYGDDIIVVFTDDDEVEHEVTVTLNEDRTFAGDYVLPDEAAGDYAFLAQCPGTDFEGQPFVLAATTVAPPPTTPVPPTAPPATPVDGEVTTTG